MFEPVDASRVTDAVQKVLGSEDDFNYQFISLFEVLSIYQEIKKDKEELKKKIETRITTKVKSINDRYYVVMHDFDYEKLVFCISICDSNSHEEVEIYFCKDEGIISIYITEGSVNHDFDHILSLIGAEVEAWYDYCYKLKEAYMQHSYHVKSASFVFLVNIAYTCVCVYYGKNHITSDFKMLSFYDGNNKFYCKCKFDNIVEILNGQENEFIKKIFIKIEDCPEWMQEHLVMERHEQISEIKRRKQEEKEVQQKLEKKKKRREVLRKIFPFIK